MSSKVWDEITCPFPNFNSCNIGVWEWVSEYIPHFRVCDYLCTVNVWDIGTYDYLSMMGLISNHYSKRGPRVFNWLLKCCDIWPDLLRNVEFCDLTETIDCKRNFWKYCAKFCSRHCPTMASHCKAPGHLRAWRQPLCMGAISVWLNQHQGPILLTLLTLIPPWICM